MNRNQFSVILVKYCTKHGCDVTVTMYKGDCVLSFSDLPFWLYTRVSGWV